MPQNSHRSFQQRINEKLGEIHNKPNSELKTVKKITGMMNHAPSDQKLGYSTTTTTSYPVAQSNLQLKTTALMRHTVNVNKSLNTQTSERVIYHENMP